MALKTLTIKQRHEFRAKVLAPAHQQGLGSGAVTLRRQWPRPRYEFEINMPPLPRHEVEPLYGFLKYHQGDIPFWFDGGDFGNIQNPILFGVGDGTTTDFLLPNNNITSPVSIWVDGQPDLNFTVINSSGLVQFTTAPGLDLDLHATYQCRFKVFIQANDLLYEHSRIFHNYYQLQFTLREKPNA